MKKLRNIILEILLGISILLFAASLIFLYQLSCRYAFDSPEISYMQYPTLIFCYIIVLAVIVALSMGHYIWYIGVIRITLLKRLQSEV